MARKSGTRPDRHPASSTLRHSSAAGPARAPSRRVIAGLDPGTVRAGLVVVECEGDSHHIAGAVVLSARGGMDLPSRVAQMARQFDRALARFKPDEVVMESIPPTWKGRTIQSSSALAMVCGAYIGIAGLRGVPVILCPTVEARRVADLTARTTFVIAEDRAIAEDPELCDALSFVLWRLAG